jgi:hypothetical protein
MAVAEALHYLTAASLYTVGSRSVAVATHRAGIEYISDIMQPPLLADSGLGHRYDDCAPAARMRQQSGTWSTVTRADVSPAGGYDRRTGDARDMRLTCPDRLV